MQVARIGIKKMSSTFKAAGVLIQYKSSFMLCKRSAEMANFANYWAPPSGMIEKGEVAHEAAVRELYEETKLYGKVIDIIGMESHFNSVFGDILLIGLTMKIKNWNTLKAGDDITDAQLFDLNNLPDLAFESHKCLINKYKQKWDRSLP